MNNRLYTIIIISIICVGLISSFFYSPPGLSSNISYKGTIESGNNIIISHSFSGQTTTSGIYLSNQINFIGDNNTIPLSLSFIYKTIDIPSLYIQDYHIITGGNFWLENISKTLLSQYKEVNILQNYNSGSFQYNISSTSGLLITTYHLTGNMLDQRISKKNLLDIHLSINCGIKPYLYKTYSCSVQGYSTIQTAPKKDSLTYIIDGKLYYN